MSDDLVKRLRYGIVEHRKRWSGDTHADLGGSVDYDATTDMLHEAADRIEELKAKLAKAVEALESISRLVDDQYSDRLYTQSHSGWESCGDDVKDKARATLAELEDKIDD